ncbi:hypothetical protein ACEPPN_000332 [Leptodophora sp. 'Broadleaf-Isolate-01']
MTIYTSEHSKHRKFTTRIPTLFTKCNELVELTDCDVAFFVRYKNGHHNFRSSHGFPDKAAFHAPYETPEDWPGRRPLGPRIQGVLGSPSDDASSSASSLRFVTPPQEPPPVSPLIQKALLPPTPHTRSRAKLAAEQNLLLSNIDTRGVSDLALRNLPLTLPPMERLPSPISPLTPLRPWSMKPAPRPQPSEATLSPFTPKISVGHDTLASQSDLFEATPSPFTPMKSTRPGRSEAGTLSPFTPKPCLKRGASVLDSEDDSEDNEITPSFDSPVTRSRLRGFKNFKFSMF